MNISNLLKAKLVIHQDRIDELKKIEKELIKMISETNNHELMDKFLDWQNQRLECNSSYLATLNIITEEK